MVFPPAFVYLIFYLAYRTPFADVDSRLGDISYGLYIYAFPVQQLVNMLFPGFGPIGNAVVSTAIVVPLAYLSWIVIEKPALSVKQFILNRVPGKGWALVSS